MTEINFRPARGVILTFVLAASLFALPASGQNNPPPPPGLPTITKKPVAPSTGLPNPRSRETTKRRSLPKPLPQSAKPLPQTPKPQLKSPPPLPRAAAVGMQLIISRQLGVSSALELDGAAICVDEKLVEPSNSDGASFQNYFSKNQLGLETVVLTDQSESLDALMAGRCDSVVLENSKISGALAELNSDGGDYVVLPEIIR